MPRRKPLPRRHHRRHRRLQTVFHMVMQATFETLQFDHLPGFLASRSVGLLPARSFGSEAENSVDGLALRTEEEDGDEADSADVSVERTNRCGTDSKVRRAKYR